MGCFLKVVKFIFSHVGLTVLVSLYALLGGHLFEWIESGVEDKPRMDVQRLRIVHQKKFWLRSIELGYMTFEDWQNHTEEIFKDYETELFYAILDSGWDGEEVGSSYTQWDLAGSVLYSICLITTIGYGNITPRTNGGKFVTIIYSIFGIPLYLMFLSNIGQFLASCIRLCFTKGRRKTDGEAAVPISFSIMLIIVYILIGAVTFPSVEKEWDYLTAAYFSFITVSTIGLGDFVPGSGPGYHDKNVLLLTILYVVIGMAVLVTTFDLMKETVLRNIKAFVRRIGLGSESQQKSQERRPVVQQKIENPRAEEEAKIQNAPLPEENDQMPQQTSSKQYEKDIFQKMAKSQRINAVIKRVGDKLSTNITNKRKTLEIQRAALSSEPD